MKIYRPLIHRQPGHMWLRVLCILNVLPELLLEVAAPASLNFFNSSISSPSCNALVNFIAAFGARASEADSPGCTRHLHGAVAFIVAAAAAAAVVVVASAAAVVSCLLFVVCCSLLLSLLMLLPTPEREARHSGRWNRHVGSV